MKRNHHQKKVSANLQKNLLQNKRKLLQKLRKLLRLLQKEKLPKNKLKSEKQELPQSQRNTQVHLQKVFQDVLLIQNHQENQIHKAKQLLFKMEPLGLYQY